MRSWPPRGARPAWPPPAGRSPPGWCTWTAAGPKKRGGGGRGRRRRQALGAADCEKPYLAEVVGALPAAEAPGSVAVTAAIGRTGRRGSRVRIEGGRRPQAARTEFFLRERRADTSLVEARLSRG